MKVYVHAYETIWYHREAYVNLHAEHTIRMRVKLIALNFKLWWMEQIDYANLE